MAQLIKLHDYISRYGDDLNRYPSQFIRMKRERWTELKKRFEEGRLQELPEAEEVKPAVKQGIRKWQLKKQVAEVELPSRENIKSDDDFAPSFVYEPATVEELKKLFMNQLFHFQLKWASSAGLRQSVVHSAYYRDRLLRQLIQSVPDSCLLLYRPVVKIKNAPVELDIVLICPAICYCITVAEAADGAVFNGGTGRFWEVRDKNETKRVLSPLISLDRTERVIDSLFRRFTIELPIRKVLLSRNGYFDIPSPIYGTEFADSRTAPEFFSKLQTGGGPFKREQFRAAEELLNITVTRSYIKSAEQTESGPPDV